VLRRAHVEGLAVYARQLEWIDPEVELEVGSVATKLVADVVPQVIARPRHRLSRPSSGPCPT
jgi:hypothetical protein